MWERRTGRRALPPRLVPDDRLVRANALLSGASQSAIVFGPLLAAVAIGGFGVANMQTAFGERLTGSLKPDPAVMREPSLDAPALGSGSETKEAARG